MDNKQLREFILQETCGIKILSLQCDGKEDCKKCSFDIILKALEQADKYRWHDLRNNPDDLPVENSQVLTWQIAITANFSYQPAIYKNGFIVDRQYRMGIADVFKWMYIPSAESER